MRLRKGSNLFPATKIFLHESRAYARATKMSPLWGCCQSHHETRGYQDVWLRLPSPMPPQLSRLPNGGFVSLRATPFGSTTLRLRYCFAQGQFRSGQRLCIFCGRPTLLGAGGAGSQENAKDATLKPYTSGYNQHLTPSPNPSTPNTSPLH